MIIIQILLQTIFNRQKGITQIYQFCFMFLLVDWIASQFIKFDTCGKMMRKKTNKGDKKCVIHTV